MSFLTSSVSNVFNAFAFAGASWVMSKIDHGDYVKEIHRHDLALEQLQKDRDAWNQARLKEMDRLAQLHYNQHESRQDIEETNKDFQHVPTKFTFDTKPKLDQYYTPSKKMTEYMNLVKFAAATSGAYMLLLLL